MKRLFTFSNLRLSIEVLLLVAVLAVALPRVAPTQAAAPPAPNAAGTVYWYQCNTPATAHVAVFSDRVHIYCPSTTPVSGAPALSGIFWFAYPTAPDSAQASRFMSLLQASAISGRYVWLEVSPTDTSGASFGCGSSNCRRFFAVEMR